jgi:hypothetical protein
MSDLTPETIAHLRELDAARTQGEWWAQGAWYHDEMAWPTVGFGTTGADVLAHAIRTPDAEFIAAAANHMGALLDAAEERSDLNGRVGEVLASVDNWRQEVSRLRAELAETRAQIERVTALAERFERWPSSPSLSVAATKVRAALAPATQREAGE